MLPEAGLGKRVLPSDLECFLFAEVRGHGSLEMWFSNSQPQHGGTQKGGPGAEEPQANNDIGKIPSFPLACKMGVGIVSEKVNVSIECLVGSQHSVSGSC